MYSHFKKNNLQIFLNILKETVKVTKVRDFSIIKLCAFSRTAS